MFIHFYIFYQRQWMLRRVFAEKKGVRQRDPISPYLFVMCIKVLTRLFDKIFSKAIVGSLQGIKEVLDSFYGMSGLW